MRKKIIAGNWKMNLDKQQAMQLASNIVEQAHSLSLSEQKLMLLAPSFLYIEPLIEKTKQYPHIKIVAQDCSEHNFGAYTGEVAAPMLQSVNVEYTIIGHSERRQYHQENNDILLKKIKQALKHNLYPIFCCGEPLDIREKNTHTHFIQQQLEEVIFQLTEKEFSKIIIAYEPIWAIGTGKTATTTQAQEMHQFIRERIKTKYKNSVSEQTTILYGGSVNAQNAKLLFECNDIDGALVGGASLKSDEFIAIANAL